MDGDAKRLESMLKKVNKCGKLTREELGPCWEMEGCGNNGYILYAGKLAHRESYRIHNKLTSIPDGMLVRHKCLENRCCINPEHLELGTKQANRDDMTRDGTVSNFTLRGINNGNAKLTDQQVQEIKALPRINQREIAKQYGVSQAHVHRIQTSEARINTVAIIDAKTDFFERAIFSKKVTRQELGECWETKYAREHRSFNNKNMQAYKAAFLYEFGSIPKDKQLNHHCDNEKCIRPAHLYAGTDKENRTDAKIRGRIASGEKHGMVKLSEENVIRIYNNSDNKTKSNLAREFNVSVATISNIHSGKNWGSITSKLPRPIHPDAAPHPQ